MSESSPKCRVFRCKNPGNCQKGLLQRKAKHSYLIEQLEGNQTSLELMLLSEKHCVSTDIVQVQNLESHGILGFHFPGAKSPMKSHGH